MNESNEWTRQGRRQERKRNEYCLILILLLLLQYGNCHASRINHTINTITQDVGNRTESKKQTTLLKTQNQLTYYY